MNLKSLFSQFLKEILELDPKQFDAIMKDADKDKIAYKLLTTAPAGSGKTRVLAARYLKLLVDGEKPENIVAITFTRKASGEMKERIVNYLHKFRDVILEKNFTEGDVAQSLRDIDTLNKMVLGMRISTIDAFLSRIIRLFPGESGIDPNFIVIDEIDEDELIDSVIDNIIEGRLEKDKELLKLLQFYDFKYIGHGFDRFCFLSDIKRIIKNWEMYSKSLSILQNLTKSDFENVIREFVGSCSDINKNLTLLIENVKEFAKHYDCGDNRMTRFITFLTQTPLKELSHDHHSFIQFNDLFLTKKMTIRKKSPMKLKDEKAKNLYSDISSLYMDSIHSFLFAYDIERAGLSQYFVDLIIRIAEELKRRKKSLGILGIGDLKMVTYELLTQHRERFNILYNMDARVNHYLIDEFQDTDPVQWEIFQKLTEDWFSGETAKQEKNIIPTIFLVGDEKQSIYGFRNADVRIITRIKSADDDPFLNISSLTKNYRSKEEIIKSVNTLFEKKMIRKSRDDYSVDYEKMVSKDAATGGTVKIFEHEIEGLKNERINKLSHIIANHILSLTDQYKKWGTIALLFRDSLNFHIYEERFEEKGIPFISSGGKSFFENREIKEIISVLTFLENPYNDVKFVEFFFSPLFDHSIADLLNIMIKDGALSKGSDKDISLFEKACSNHYDEYKRFLSMTKNWLHLKDRISYIQLVERIIMETNTFGIFVDRRGGQKEVNIRKLISLIENISEEKMNFSFFFDRLHRTIKAREKNADIDIGTMTFEQESTGAVHLTTVHKAKGLEFPVVIIPEVDSVTIRRKGEGIYVDTDNHLILFLKKVKGFDTPLFDLIKKREEEKEEEELKRLLYVALTRAQNELYMFISVPKTEENKIWKNIIYDSDHPILRKFELSLPTKKESIVIPEEKYSIYEFEKRKKIIPVKRKIIPSEIGKTTSLYKPSIVRSEMKGKILHKFFESIASNKITISTHGLSNKQIRKIALQMDPQFLCDSTLIKAIKEDLRKVLEDKTIMKIITHKNSLNEFQCTVQRTNESGEKEIIPSVIDKIIFENERILIYDYKTDSPNGGEKKQFVDTMKNKYKDQLNTYRIVVMNTFGKKEDEVSTFLILTKILKIVEVNCYL